MVSLISFGTRRVTSGLRLGTQPQIIETLTSTTDHMKESDAYPAKIMLVQVATHFSKWGVEVVQLKSTPPMFWIWIDLTSNEREMAACWRNAIRITSTTATKKPKENVTTKIIFCLNGRRIFVRSGIGRNRIARSVMIFTGEEDR